MKPFPIINNNWTLFLDRDGVINEEKHLDYIHHWDEFIFYPNAAKAIASLRPYFKYIIVVTNQRGIGKGLTKAENLNIIHQNMCEAIIREGGSINKVYYCPDLDNESPNRKPNPGMALQAKLDFPEIDFTQSVMIGNNISDMKFGRNIGAFTVFLTTTHPDILDAESTIDYKTDSLFSLTEMIVNYQG